MTEMTYFVEADFSKYSTVTQSLKNEGYKVRPLYRRFSGEDSDSQISMLRNFLRVRLPKEKEQELLATMQSMIPNCIKYFQDDWVDFQKHTDAPNYTASEEGRIPVRPEKSHFGSSATNTPHCKGAACAL